MLLGEIVEFYECMSALSLAAFFVLQKVAQSNLAVGSNAMVRDVLAIEDLDQVRLADVQQFGCLRGSKLGV